MSRFFLILTIIFMPCYVFRGVIPIPHTNISIPTTLLEILFVFSFCVSLFEFVRDGLPFNKLKTNLDLIILCFLINAFLSVFFSTDIYGGLGIFKAYFLEPIIFFYMLIYQSRRSSGKFIVYSLIFSGFLLCILALVQKVTGLIVFAPQEQEQNRVSAVYNSANALALYIGPISILSFTLFIRKTKKKKLLFLILSLFMFGIIFLTRSRGGLIAELISIIIFIYGMLALKKKYLMKFWYLIPVIVFLLVSSFFIQVYQTYSTYSPNIAAKEVRGDTLHIRYLIWVSTIQLLKDNPVFGSGLNGFKKVYEDMYKPPIFSEDFQYPHNLFLTFWVETGILGLILFTILIYQIYALVLKNMIFSNYLLGLGIISMMTYWLIHGVVDVPYFKNDLSMEFWVVVALVIIWSEKREIT